MKISVLGPAGSYSEKAAQLFFKKCRPEVADKELIYSSTIENAVLSLWDEKNPADYAVIPIENSIEGAVGVSMDLLNEKDVAIGAEIIIRIEHCLLSREAALSDIDVVYSHPQGLYQCRNFLRENLKNVRLIETDSTSKAAQMAAANPRSAAIASAEAGRKYGLNTLETNIQSVKNNRTRFVLISKRNESNGFIFGDVLQYVPENEFETDGNGKTYLKTSVVSYLKNDKPGALYHILGAFFEHTLNLTRIESRPAKKELGDYCFYIDFEGDRRDENVQKALEDALEQSDRLKMLGTYGRLAE
ncbi:Bifunctional chorismate mutase/prephenate dehydratase [Methanosarcinaceae archaeon Ag5]|uniref:prephenate dehydratase n=1 Tax=Methanolapillus africanus TaxID=3028297 RepID=A0AAE4SEH4_9EURY|nr:Bifunctional chorismate mutase/prephenate dehydratase [Methanosarcinaceae archaeon Ag5]